MRVKKTAHAGNRRIRSEPGGSRWPGSLRVPPRSMLIAMGIAVVLIVTAALWWQSRVTVRTVEFKGVQYANLTELRNRVPVEKGARMNDVDRYVVADSVVRHPWIESARAATLFNGIIEVYVEERTPVMLVLNQRGAPVYYIDHKGYQLPYVAGAVFDVPVVRGSLPEFQSPYRIGSPTIRDLANALSKIPEEVNVLLSEITISSSGTVEAKTTPTAEGQMIPVRLGRNGFLEKFESLRAFWEQAVIPQPDKVFRSIDLRFDGQIVTRESDS